MSVVYFKWDVALEKRVTGYCPAYPVLGHYFAIQQNNDVCIGVMRKICLAVTATMPRTASNDPLNICSYKASQNLP